MQDRRRHDASRDFARAAATALAAKVDGGAELRFELVEEAGGGAVLYRYRTLTGEFIREHWETLRALPEFQAAAERLGARAENYLRVRGLPGADGGDALRAMLERVYEDATTFDFPDERFERIYIELERIVQGDSLRAIVATPLEGVALDGDEVDLGDGLALLPADALEDLPEPLRSESASGVEPPRPSTLCVFRRDIPLDGSPPVSEARARFRELLTALRLLRPGAPAFGPLLWARTDDGIWSSFSLGLAGREGDEPWTLAQGEAADLRELQAALARSRHRGAIAWALRRFELGCERSLETEALSDYLLALRALLDAADETGRASVSLRLAALCADEHERQPVQRRVELAFALERFVIAGGSGSTYLETIGSESPQGMVFEIEGYLRALLADVICGYLDPDLKGLADEILLTGGEELEIHAQDLRTHALAEPAASEERPAIGEFSRSDESARSGEHTAGESMALDESAEPARAEESAARDAAEDPTTAAEEEAEAEAEMEVGAEARSPRTTQSEDAATEEFDELVADPVTAAPDDGVTPSADWGFDEDRARDSAPA